MFEQGQKGRQVENSFWETGVKSWEREEIFNGWTCNRKENSSKMQVLKLLQKF